MEANVVGGDANNSGINIWVFYKQVAPLGQGDE